MRVYRLMVLLALVLSASAAAAQEQRGSIDGVVKDSSGGVLPGVTIEARSARGAVLTTTSDSTGNFRFPSVQPGTYSITANLAGFRPAAVQNIEVVLGQTRTVEFTLAVATVTETVTVTGESPVVDIKQSQRSTNIRAEQIDLLPHGRDFTTLVTQAPGANDERKLGGLSIDGASAAENRYIVDGMETTNLQNGLSGHTVIADFIDEVQVHSSGYTAEYGGAMGGVINAVTKSGTNDWHGYGLMYWQGDSLENGRRLSPTEIMGVPTLRQSLTNSDVAEYITYPADNYNRYEPGIAIGGPLARNKAWFFGAYQPAVTPMERRVTPVGTTTPVTVRRTDQVQYLTANQTAQIGSDLRTRVSFNDSWSKQRGLLPALAGTDPADSNYSKTSAYPNWTVSGNLDWVASPKMFFGVRGGYYNSDQHDTNVTEQPRFLFGTTTNIGLAGVPADLQRPTNFASIPSNLKTDRDQQMRAYFQVDGTWYGKAAGQHQLKAGLQLDRLGNNVLTGESRNRVTIRWNTSLPTGRPLTRGPFGYYSVRSNGVAPQKGFITEGNVHSTNVGLFVQDAWTVASRLTINAGVRTERERVPAYATGPDIPDFGVTFNFADKLAPRVGFAYDLRGDGRWKTFGSWGIFYDIFKLELPRGSFGGDKWLEYYYTLDTPDWPHLVDGGNCPPACSGTLIRGPIDFRHPSFGSDAIEPALKPMRQQEATFGVDHEFTSVIAGTLRYVHKQLDRAIDDTGSLDEQGNEIYIIANPGEGLTKVAFPGVAMPLPKRDYDSVEFAIEKRLSNRWFLRTSYLWSRLRGNYTGLSQSDENGRTSPNVGRSYDYPLMMFTGTGQPSYGRLPTDRPSQFKTQFIYAFDFGTSVGLNEYVASGIPVTREIGVIPGSNYPVQYSGRFSDGRTDVYSQMDMYVQHEFKLAGNRRVQLQANVQNLFNQRAGTSKFSTQQKTTSLEIDEAAFYAGRLNFANLIQQQQIAVDPRFLMTDSYQLPITARLGVKLLF